LEIIGEKLYTPAEAAEILGVHLKTVYRYIKRGKIKTIEWTERVRWVKGSELKRMKGEAA
jgi:putative resolvase